MHMPTYTDYKKGGGKYSVKRCSHDPKFVPVSPRCYHDRAEKANGSVMEYCIRASEDIIYFQYFTVINARSYM